MIFQLQLRLSLSWLHETDTKTVYKIARSNSPLQRKSATVPWNKCTAKYVPYHSSLLQCRAPLDIESTISHGVPVEVHECSHFQYNQDSSK